MTSTTDAIAEKLASLFNNPTDSDITILAGPENIEFHAHLAILGLHTQFFHQAVSSKSGFSEASTKTVSLPGHAVVTVSAMLEYCYKCKYYPGPPDENIAIRHFDVYMLGDMLLMGDLKNYVKSILIQTMVAFNLEEKVYVHGKYTTKEIPPPAWYQKFPDLIVKVYGNTSKDVKRGGDLRDIIAVAAWSTLDHGWEYTKELRKAVELTGEFGGDMVEVGRRGMMRHVCSTLTYRKPQYTFISI